MSLKNRLNNLEQSNKIEHIPISKINVERFFDKANKACRFSKNAISSYKDYFEYDNNIFTSLYDVIRMGFTSLLALYGYKTKTSGGNHYLTFEIAPDILKEELIKNYTEYDLNKIDKALKRISCIVSKRNSAQYDPIDNIISRTDLIFLLADIEFLLKEIGLVILNNEQ
jgi:hypothetical protein